jgi:Domain of unknown function (DUF4157)
LGQVVRYSKEGHSGCRPLKYSSALQIYQLAQGNSLLESDMKQFGPIVDQYIGFLQNQAGNNVYRLSDSIIRPIQPFYSVDLHNIRYAAGINTINGENITIVNTIYFVRGMNFSDPNDAWTLYHELAHAAKYANRGGVEPFLAEYVLKAGGSVLRGGKLIDIHDNIDLENAANAKANQVMNAVGVAGT